MKYDEEIMKDFWETFDLSYSHIVLKGGLEYLVRGWERDFIRFYDLENKNVADYGCGGGYLGMHLLSNHNINKYKAIDISQRSLDYSSKNLESYKDKTSFYLTPVDFSELEVDVFISLACIQHFHSREYLISFLENLNTSEIPELMLQIRNDEDTLFVGEGGWVDELVSERDAYYERSRLCHTNKDFLLEHLTNYELTLDRHGITNTDYQFIGFKRKGD